MSTRTGTYKIHKKLGAAGFTLWLPTYSDEGFIKREGAVGVEVAKPAGTDDNGNTTYNWKDGKIIFALGSADLAILFDDFSKRLVHDKDGNIKTFQFQPATKAEYAGTFMLNITSKEGTETSTVSVPVTAGEAQFLGELFKAAVPRIFGW